MPTEKPESVTHVDIIRRLEAGDRRFRALEAAQAEANERGTKNAETLGVIKDLVSALPEMQRDVLVMKEIVEVWNRGKSAAAFFVGAGKVLKWAAGIIGALGIIMFAARTVGSAWIEWGSPKP